jgi:Fe-Mn family superoxide dismutase
MKATRKNFLKTSAVLTAGALINNSLLEAAVNKVNQQPNEFLYTLPKLGYAYDALEPYIDAKTMEIHYTKHHQAYVTKLNEAIAKDASLKGHKLDHLIAHINQVPEPLRAAIRNQGGGHWNNSFFWQLLKTKTSPSAKVTEAINKDFGSMDEFKKQFEKAAMSQFGSGWAWLIKANDKLQVVATPNQDNPLMDIALVKGTPIIALDVWEHAYYLKYQNKRADYVSAFWNVLDWNKVESLLFSS